MLEFVVSALCAPYAIAIVLGRSPTTALVIAAIGGVLLLARNLRARVPICALGVALAITRDRGPMVAAIAIAVAGILATAGGLIGVEAVFRRMPARARAVVVCGAAVATGVLLVARAPLAFVDPSSVVADVAALALAMSFDAALVSRRAGLHVLSTSLLLPVVVAHTRMRRDALTIVAACALLVTLAMVPAHAFAVATIAVAAINAVRAEISELQPTDLLSVGAIGLALHRTRPTVAVVIAVVIAAALATRATSRAKPDPAS